MVYVEGGTFQMGSDGAEGDADEQPVHTVTLSSFYIGESEVTNAEYCEFLNAYGSNKAIGGEYDGVTMIIEYEWGVKKNGALWEPQAGFENHPVVPLSWVGANEYCNWRGVRLPTEAEWEYAARGGQNMTSTLYAGSNNIDDVAWYVDNSWVANSSREDKTGPMPVKQKAPNELGIYDMSGNLWEACVDWYDENFYSQSANTTNPLCDTGPKELKVWRGGSWHNTSPACRVFDRGWRSPSDYLSVFGLRVAASAP